MRFFEFADQSIDRIVAVLRNYVGRAASKKAPAKLNWNGLNTVLKTNGFEQGADYESFKAMFDSSQALQNMVKDFNADGVELKVPGAADSGEAPKTGAADSQAEVDKIAATAAPQQLAAQA